MCELHNYWYTGIYVCVSTSHSATAAIRTTHLVRSMKDFAIQIVGEIDPRRVVAAMHSASTLVSFFILFFIEDIINRLSGHRQDLDNGGRAIFCIQK